MKYKNTSDITINIKIGSDWTTTPSGECIELDEKIANKFSELVVIEEKPIVIKEEKKPIVKKKVSKKKK